MLYDVAIMASITQYRGKTWRAVIRRAGFPSQSKTFDLKKDAVAWAAAIESKLGVSRFDKLQMKQASVTTVKEIFVQYRDEVASHAKGRNAVNILNRLIRDAEFMRIRLDRVTSNDIRDWRDARVKEIQPASVHRELNSISGVFTHAMKEWSAPFEVNPCHKVSRFKNADNERDLMWTEADIQKFLKAAKWQDGVAPTAGREYCGWALLLLTDTAMRIGELCMLKVGDFRKDDLCVFLSDTKNGDSREVPLSAKSLKIIEMLCQNKRSTDKIIPLVSGTLGEYMLDVRRVCGLEHLHQHDGRHTAATAMSKKLSNVLELAAVTGHRSLKSLKRYYHPKASYLANKLG